MKPAERSPPDTRDPLFWVVGCIICAMGRNLSACWHGPWLRNGVRPHSNPANPNPDLRLPEPHAGLEVVQGSQGSPCTKKLLYVLHMYASNWHILKYCHIFFLHVRKCPFVSVNIYSCMGVCVRTCVRETSLSSGPTLLTPDMWTTAESKQKGHKSLLGG